MEIFLIYLLKIFIIILGSLGRLHLMIRRRQEGPWCGFAPEVDFAPGYQMSTAFDLGRFLFCVITKSWSLSPGQWATGTPQLCKYWVFTQMGQELKERSTRHSQTPWSWISLRSALSHWSWNPTQTTPTSSSNYHVSDQVACWPSGLPIRHHLFFKYQFIFKKMC